MAGATSSEGTSSGSMEKESKNTKKNLMKKLPAELISTILQYADIEDIVAFGATCKYFNDMIKNSQMLWKIKLKNMLPADIFVIVEKDCSGGNWFNQVKEFYTVRQKVYCEVLAMSPKYFWQNNSITLHDVRRFFTIALSSNMNYYYTVFLLQELVNNGAKNIGLWQGQLPYTMTEMHYAKVVLCHLMHSFLAVKWAQRYTKDELLPQAVLTFFMQWVDVVKLYTQDEVDSEILDLVRDVEMVLVPTKPKTAIPGERVKEQLAAKKLKERDVISGITHILYQCRQIVVTPTMDIETLSIPEVLKKKSGHMIAIATIFHAVARHCGIQCDVIAFPNHFFLEWKCNDIERRPQLLKINVTTGEVQQNRRCPYADLPPNSSCVYCPNSLLRYIITTFTKTVGPGYLGANNWYRQNAFLLFELLNPEAARDSPYYNYFRYLTHDVPLSTLSPISIKYIENEHLQIILTLTYLNTPVNTCGSTRSVIVKIRNSNVKYAVGMICCHKKYQYYCIIVGWDAICEPSYYIQHPEDQTLQYGLKQPFYNVIAADESSRYVAQENLTSVTYPQRMLQLEDLIAPEFTHFNGYAYVPNKEKRVEYPEDLQISSMFGSRAVNRVGVKLLNPPAVSS